MAITKQYKRFGWRLSGEWKGYVKSIKKKESPMIWPLAWICITIIGIDIFEVMFDGTYFCFALFGFSIEFWKNYPEEEDGI